jgi:H+/Cl- antiporter ClcA
MSETAASNPPADLARQGAYMRLLLLAAAFGIPISLISFVVLVGLHEAEHWVWAVAPPGAGEAPWWWPLPLLTLAGGLVGILVQRLPGRGGHIPAEGLSASPTPPSQLPWVLLTAFVSLPLGAVLGPEAPLIATGGALALFIGHRLGIEDGTKAASIVAVAGTAAAIATIFGNPVIALVMIIEVVGLGGRQLTLVLLPAMMAVGVGGLMFTGLGSWTGLSIGALTLPLPQTTVQLDLPDLLWTLPVAIVAALATRVIRGLGRTLVPRVLARPVPMTLAVGVAVGICAAAYSLITDHGPADIALSGQQTLAHLASSPASFSPGTLVALLVFKGLGYALSLGALRGGPVFPAVCLGAALGVLVAPLPGFGLIPAFAVGMVAATVSALPLPVSSIVLVAVLMGSVAQAIAPVILLAGVVAFVTEQIAEKGLFRGAQTAPEAAAS